MNNTNVPAGSLYIMQSAMLLEGTRIFAHSIRIKLKGYKRYEGNAKDICRQIVEDCWNGRYFQTSTGHFCQFYSRDFGLCVDSLIKLGYLERVRKTLEYALNRYEAHGKITVAVTPQGTPFNFPSYGIDSLAFMLRSLDSAKAKDLVGRHKNFLNREIHRMHAIAVDKIGMAKRDCYFSTMKDHAKRKSSCYDNVMLHIASSSINNLGLENPFKEYNYAELIKGNFWTGEYFLDDLSGKRHIAGDANIFPYWAGLYDDYMLKKSISAIKSARLDKPFPLKYTNGKAPQEMIWQEAFVKGWEKDAIWTQLGPVYISLLKRINGIEANKLKRAYGRWIEQNRTYIEVFNANGELFTTPFYNADEGMLWASLYLAI